MNRNSKNEKRRRNDRFAGLEASTLSAVEKASLMALAMSILAARHDRGQVIKAPADTEAYLRLRLADQPNERFGCLYLDNRHRVLDLRELFHGTIDGTSVYPRVVVQQTLAINAAAVILFHNHPSGVAEPSQADERITRRLKAALELIDVPVLDHLIVASGECVSMASRGLI